MNDKVLYFLRHAKSSREAPGLHDHDRPLSGRGRRVAPLMARVIASQENRPDLILCSTAVRAVQTAVPVCEALPGVPVVYDRRVYTFSAPLLLARLREVAEEVRSLLVIGHNPAIQDLALLLCDSHGQRRRQETLLHRLGDKYPTAALAALQPVGERPLECQWQEMDKISWQLSSFVRPVDVTATEGDRQEVDSPEK